MWKNVSTVMEFVTLPPSATGNGIGGATAVLSSTDPTVVLANPALLGLSSFTNTLSVATFTPKTAWLPDLPFRDLYPPMTNFATAVNVGFNVSNVLRLPVPVGLGLGYSRHTLDLGRYQTVPPATPDIVLGTHPIEQADVYSLGLAVDYWVRLAVGWNFKRLSSGPYDFYGNSGWILSSTTAHATDFGVSLLVPVADISSRATGKPLEILHGVRPLLNLMASYVRANVGDAVQYPGTQELYSLPRTGTLGVAAEAALTTKVGLRDWKLLSASIIRQAETNLWWFDPDGALDYASGAGRINFLENVIGGRATSLVITRMGWQVELGECLTLRAGSFHRGGEEWGNVTALPWGADTYGYGIALGGLVRLLEYTSPPVATIPWVKFVGEHLDLQFQKSLYQSSGSPLNGTSFQTLNLVVKGVPWQQE